MLIEHANIERTALQGSIAVVTGAGQGIGKETAHILASLGAAVVIAEINETGREAAQLIQSEGGRALFVQTDVSDPASMEHLHQQILQTFGDVDILVNNAAAFTTKPILEHTVAEWDRVFAVNLRGAFLGIQAFLPAMLQHGKGVIITMESAEGMPYLAPYLASKVGLRSLASSLAQEVGSESGAWIYCFGAGMVETPGGMGAFRQLAPYYGMNLEQFIGQSAPGGQLITAELCATGLVGTILHAHEFHGQETDYVAGLARLGLSASGERSDTQPQQVIDARHLAPALLREALTLNQQLEAIVQANIKEYAEQNMFVRPVVKRMFQQGTGLTVEDWLAQAQAMTRRLESLSSTGGSGQPALDPSTLETYLAHLQRMAEYITRQEADARGWITDPDKLKVAEAALQEREETVQQLAGVLKEIQQQG